jgi:fucose 4-O-acetylase-like acetyltransferase
MFIMSSISEHTKETVATGSIKLKQNSLSIIRAIGVFSIVCAHTTSVPDTATSVSRFVSRFFLSTGQLGVGIFFVIAGYLFAVKNHSNLGEFLHRKIQTLIIPWSFCSTLVYLFVAVRKNSF